MVYGGYLYILTSQLIAWLSIDKAALWRFKKPADVRGQGVQCIIGCGYGSEAVTTRLNICEF